MEIPRFPLKQLSLLTTFFTLIIISHYPNPCSSSKSKIHPSQSPLIFPLKAAQIPKTPNKLSFHHNVSLTVTLSIGSPPQQVTMVLDTGSELSWLHCNTKTPTPTFTPHLSSTYRPIPCSSPTCTSKTRDLTIPPSCAPTTHLCHVTLSYADASSVEGHLALDTLRFPSPGPTLPGIIFGCMDSGSSTNPDEDSKSTGLIGMNRGALSFVSQLGSPKFSYCISATDSSGLLLLGDANLPWLKPLNYTPLIKITTPLPYFDRVAYTVQLEGIRVGGTVLRLPRSVFEPDHTGAGQTMVDSGTQFTFLLGPVYSALRNEFLRQTKGVLKPLGEPDFVFQGAMDLCYRVGSVLPVLPSVGLRFSGVEMSVSGERLLYRVAGVNRGGDSVYCFTFGNSDLLGVEAYIIGHHHQQNVWMEFDLVRSRVGLAEVRCDLASQRLGLAH